MSSGIKLNKLSIEIFLNTFIFTNIFKLMNWHKFLVILYYFDKGEKDKKMTEIITE